MPLKIEILPSSTQFSPRELHHSLATMYTWHRRYTLGDVPVAFDPVQVRELTARLKKTRAEVLPVYLYDHSGLRVSTTPFSCRWDSGQVGVIAIEPAQGQAEWGRRWRSKARAYMVDEVSQLDQYLSGDVYDVVVRTPDGVTLDYTCNVYGRESAEELAKRLTTEWATTYCLWSSDLDHPSEWDDATNRPVLYGSPEAALDSARDHARACRRLRAAPMPEVVEEVVLQDASFFEFPKLGLTFTLDELRKRAGRV